MYKNWMPLVIITTLVLSLFFPFSLQNKYTYAQSNDLIVAGDILYLREGPGLSYPIITTLKKGDALTSIEQDGDWFHVKAGSHEGWVASWLTAANDTKESNKKDDAGKIVVSQVDRLNIRSEPALSAVVLGQLSTGQQANFLQENNGWIQIEADGKIGWVSQDYVTINTLETTPSKEETKSEEIETSTSSFEEGVQYFTVQVDALNIRKKPDLNARKIDTVKKGQVFKIVDQQNNWIQVQLPNDKTGWIYSFYGTISVGLAEQTKDKESSNKKTTSSTENEQYVTIIYNGTNLREEPSTSSEVVTRADAGKFYKILETEDDWYKVEVDKKRTAYVADWVVTVTDDIGNNISSEDDKDKKTPRKKGTLKGLTIVVDAGHGGNDKGTTGVRGTDEKDLTLETTTLLASKLSSAGANVVMTRESDEYVDLRKRVSISHQEEADAFVSIHFDATDDSSINGFTTYYLNSNQQQLAEYVHNGLKKKINLKNRDVQQGNYLVLRENKQPAILIELGYLSNASEERAVSKAQFREQATLGIYNGLLNYFDDLLE